MSASFEKGEKDELQVNVQDARESIYRRPTEKEVQHCRPCRLCIVGSFVLLLIGLLVASIVLIALTEKCEQPVTSPDVDTSLSYELDLKTFNETKGRLDYFKELGVNNVILTGVLSQEDFTLKKGIGTEDDLKSFLAASKEKNIKVTIRFDPLFVYDTSPWFKQSTNGTSKRNWFIWKPKNVTNNWLDFSGLSPWHKPDDDVKNKTFYSFIDKFSPMLNYNEPDVVDQMLEIFKKFLDMGINGFFLPMVSRLAVDSQLRNNTPKYKYDQDTPKTHKILQSFYKTISTKGGTLYVSPNTGIQNHISYLGSREAREANVVFVNMNKMAIMNKIDVSRINETLTAFGSSTSNYLNIGWQTRNNEYPSLIQRVSNPEQGRAFVLFSLLLPQAVQMISGDEALVTDASDLKTSEPVSNFTDVSRLRIKLDVFQHIPRVVFAKNDSIVLIYNKKIVVAANFGGAAVKILQDTKLGSGKYIFNSKKSLVDTEIVFLKSFELKSYDVIVVRLV